jgi:hypothetical protein
MGVWVWILIILQISLPKPIINSKMTKPAFQIPHHIGVRIIVYALPRSKLPQNIGAGGDGLPHSAEMDEIWVDDLRQFARKLRRVRGLYGQTV